MSAASGARRAALVVAILSSRTPSLLAAPASSPAPSADRAPPADPSGARVVDRVAARFYAPEMGGAAEPHFVAERTLAFEARLARMAETPEGLGEDYEDRHVREALDHHVAQTMLATLARKLVRGAAPGRRASDAEIQQVERDLSAAFAERLGGRPRVDAAAAAEQLQTSEVDGIFRRQALAAWYLDRTAIPLLNPTEEQLGEAFRTYAHPYRGQPFERVRAALQRWFVVERARVAEGAFLQAARSRLVVVITR